VDPFALAVRPGWTDGADVPHVLVTQRLAPVGVGKGPDRSLCLRRAEAHQGQQALGQGQA
jgi:hypothetical protein